MCIRDRSKHNGVFVLGLGTEPGLTEDASVIEGTSIVAAITAVNIFFIYKSKLLYVIYYTIDLIFRQENPRFFLFQILIRTAYRCPSYL